MNDAVRSSCTIWSNSISPKEIVQDEPWTIIFLNTSSSTSLKFMTHRSLFLTLLSITYLFYCFLCSGLFYTGLRWYGEGSTMRCCSDKKWRDIYAVFVAQSPTPLSFLQVFCGCIINQGRRKMYRLELTGFRVFPEFSSDSIEDCTNTVNIR